MERFTEVFADFLVFVYHYHCFDRMVIHGYLVGLSRPEQVVYFFRQVLGMRVVSKEILKSAHQRLPGLGRGVRAQPQNPDGTAALTLRVGLAASDCSEPPPPASV